MTTFALPPQVTVMEAGEVARTAIAALGNGEGAGTWIIDAAALQTFDSSCLAVLLELRRHAGARSVELRRVPPRLEHLAVAYGMEFALGQSQPIANAPAETLRP
ncbi:MAG: STAS domain-containing protein [Proteobacteria bacterium]|nr:STAS domain-containing protein [Pseudomonadota bacterium]